MRWGSCFRGTLSRLFSKFRFSIKSMAKSLRFCWDRHAQPGVFAWVPRCPPCFELFFWGNTPANHLISNVLKKLTCPFFQAILAGHAYCDFSTASDQDTEALLIRSRSFVYFLLCIIIIIINKTRLDSLLVGIGKQLCFTHTHNKIDILTGVTNGVSWTTQMNPSEGCGSYVFQCRRSLQISTVVPRN